MIVPLARKTLLYEWRRFLPALLSVAFSALLLLVMSALVMGIFGSAAVPVERSGGDLWVGYPGTQSVELGRSLPRDTELWLSIDPGVASVEALRWVDADWRSRPEAGAVSISVSGIDTRAGAAMYADALDDALRARLAQPDTVVVDAADLDKLATGIGERVRINGHALQVVGTATGLRTLGGVNVLASLDTAARLQAMPGELPDARATYWIVRLRDPAAAPAVQARLAARGASQGFEVWTRAAYAQRAIRYWMFETGAGLGVLFLGAMVCLVGAAITSQTLMAAVAGSAPEYATLNALGVGWSALRAVVVQQAAWVGSIGLLLGGAGAALSLVLARRQDVPTSLSAPVALACAALVMTIALVSGLAAVRALHRADPALLLR